MAAVIHELWEKDDRNLLILPGTNVLAFLYLALSKGNTGPTEAVTPPPRQSMVLGEA